ncbi:hypothetical protein [Saccharothrix sp. ST-888]|uniref:hypothetical protein n=1 Tax=Saccharothrix sp. ST-888 TaxID=1427391 RepID=UPI0018CF95B5|nr:hypothetical protein [Saccharothrix sp. ST-888]
MDTYDERLGQDIGAWAEDQLASSPEWVPEQYAGMRQRLEGTPPLLLPMNTTPPRAALP